MNKYEIMLILDPKADEKVAHQLIEHVFDKENIKEAKKLENTDLAYEINKSSKAQYFLFTIEAESKLIAEFKRRANILKNLWRYLVINLDSERGYGKERKQRPGKKYFSQDKKSYSRRRNDYNNNDKEENKDGSLSEDKEFKRTRKVSTRRTTTTKNVDASENKETRTARPRVKKETKTSIDPQSKEE